MRAGRGDVIWTSPDRESVCITARLPMSHEPDRASASSCVRDGLAVAQCNDWEAAATPMWGVSSEFATVARFPFTECPRHGTAGPSGPPGHGRCAGVRAHDESHPDWVFTIVPAEIRAVPGLRTVESAGVIAAVFSDELADALLALGRPAVPVTLLEPAGIPAANDLRACYLAKDCRLVAAAVRVIGDGHPRRSVSGTCSAPSPLRRILERQVGRPRSGARARGSVGSGWSGPDLLAATGWSTAEVARAASCSHRRHFSDACRREMGTTPSAERERFRGRRGRPGSRRGDHGRRCHRRQSLRVRHLILPIFKSYIDVDGIKTASPHIEVRLPLPEEPSCPTS